MPFQLAIYRDDGASSLIRITKILRVLPGRRIVAKAEDEDRLYLVKIFIGRGARRYANREIRGVLAIEDAGVRTPFFEWQGRLQAGGGEILAFEYIEDATSLFEDWRTSDGELRQRLMQGVIPELARLHESGVIQKDIHPENFLIQQDRVYTIDGGHVHDATSACLSHMASTPLGQKEQPLEVHILHLIPVLLFQIQRVGRDIHPRIVDEDFDTP